MSIRQKLNNTPLVGIAVAVVMVGVAVWVLTSYFGGGPSGEAYYTADDGKTWFADDMNRVVPFDHDGQQAVRAYIYECDGEAFAGYLERYKPEAAERMRSAGADSGEPVEDMAAVPQLGDYELKRPGEPEWVAKANFTVSADIENVKCPDGTFPLIVRP